MSFVLRKAWELFFTSTTPTPLSSSISNFNYSNDLSELSYSAFSSDIGHLEKLPFDILMQILKLLGPKEVAKLSIICKSLRYLVKDNRLWVHFLQIHQSHPSWDSLFFAETTLIYGFPLPSLIGQRPQLSFMQIYGQREQVPGAIIIDGGSGYCKFGWSKYECPSGRSATFLEFGNIETPMYTRLRHFFATIYNRMQVKPNTQPVIVSTPLCHYEGQLHVMMNSIFANRKRSKSRTANTIVQIVYISALVIFIFLSCT